MAVYKLRFHPDFVGELELAIEYYNQQSKALGRRFKSAVKKQLVLTTQNPQARSIRYDNIRFARIERFPYAIHYSIDAAGVSVLVHSLLSDLQDPEANWKSKL